MDKILLTNMRFYGHHGVSEEERAHGQTLRVDVEVEADLSRAGISDRLTDTVDYAEVHEVARQVVEYSSKSLIETLAQAIASQLLEKLPIVGARVTVAKLAPPISHATMDSASVEIYRTQT